MNGPHVVVVGGGITGLTAAYRLLRSRPDVAVTLVEAAPRLGGKIVTEHVDGFAVEGGPDSLVTFKPQAVALARELGLEPRLLPAARATAGTYLSVGGRLRPMPDGMAGLVPTRLRSLVTTPLLSPWAKLRMAAEPVVPVRRSAGDESLGSFVTRRLGRGFHDALAEPLAGGIFGADTRDLSLLATMPHLAAAERQHGSLTRFVRSQRGRAPQGSGVVAPEGGLGELVEVLASALTGADVRTSTQVTWVEPAAVGYEVGLDHGGPLAADAVLLAVPAAVVARTAAALSPELGELLAGFRQGSTVTVTLGFARGDLPGRLPGHGYLVPAREGRAARACTWSSVKFPGRAPRGRALLRVSLGGSGRADTSVLGDEELVGLALEELRATLAVTAEPVLVRVHRWEGVMPQYTLGHVDRVARTEELLSGHDGVVLAGSAFHGAGIADCVASGERAAARALAALGSGQPRGVRRPAASR
ncbi:MAG TPA: protoporphyrinogen oxidase [Nocardioidaceae bacterium]|nr:protoporphyrinogen oxidase [Nocardioidaceae bacterium]